MLIVPVLGSEMRSVFTDIINLANMNMKIWRKSAMIIMISRMMKVAQVNFFHSFQLLPAYCNLNRMYCANHNGKTTLKTNYISDLNLEQLPFNMKIDACSKHFFTAKEPSYVLWLQKSYEWRNITSPFI